VWIVLGSVGPAAAWELMLLEQHHYLNFGFSVAGQCRSLVSSSLGLVIGGTAVIPVRVNRRRPRPEAIDRLVEQHVG
jgi:hypothetical protein